MKKANKLYPLTLLLLLSACDSEVVKEVGYIRVNSPKTNEKITYFDTVRVIGVNVNNGPYGREDGRHVRFVNKQGVISEARWTDVHFMGRGDTIVIDGKGNFVKNLTEKRLAEEFVNGK